MVADRIEREIVIAAPPERVWAVLTDPAFLGTWFGSGGPAELDLRAGGRLVFDRLEHGTVPARIERVEPPRCLAYRWSQGLPGEEPGEGNSTLVEFTLVPDGAATRLRMVESGFAGLDTTQDVRRARRDQNNAGWHHKLAELRQHTEQLVV
ncbi:SRPBCC family protein [Kitasatospora sp. NBC_00240]|uniref:SRPBCC family protein n=1 Tax=Kitasatospora sp. NBC_00240 TaxID=2903567 RepID=UPI00225AA553|nr:SRPBCC family protein [Kitasatospora sp. NBC_00240]MCX5214823.1 SRPBCC family protein [Kitasatospora sp. NBC_00240]